MRLKSFHGPNSTEAMRMVREALGENAIIVATRDDETGGVRVTAAIDDTPLAAAAANAGPAPAQLRDDGSEALEIIAEALTRHQVPAHLAERLMATATQFADEDPVVALAAAFDTHFQFLPLLEEKLDKPLMLVGPPGAGKTLCVAKFATKMTMNKHKVTVVSTDFERAGGMEQLAAFTRLLKLDLIEIEDNHALREVITLSQGGFVFIDTAGRNPFSEVERKQIKACIAAAGADTVLVLPAGIDASEGVDMAQHFQALGATRLLLTRLDMTKRLGSMLRVAFDTKLPLANFSASSKVTEVPQPFNPVVLARMVLPKSAKTEQQARSQA